MKSMLTLLLSLPASFLIAQSADQHIITTQGDYSKGEKISLSWTIGDLVTEASVLDQTTVTQGFQQPVITVREIGISDPKDFTATNGNASDPVIQQRSQSEFAAHVHPNPFGVDITVQVENANKEYRIDIFDAAGNLISRIKSNNPQEQLNLGQLPVAQYLLRVSMLESDETKMFQITKSR